MKLLTLILIILPTILSAQIPGLNKPLTLSDCYKLGLENNFDIILQEERVETADAQLRSSFGRYLPRITANATYSRQLTNLNNQIVLGDRVFDASINPNRYNLRTGASLTIFDGFQREYIYSSSDDRYEASKLNYDHIKKQVKIQIYRAFTEVVRNSQIVRIRQENLELGEKDLERIKAHYDAGAIPITNVYSQESELGNLEYDLITAQNNLATAKAEILRLMGLEPDLEVEFDLNSIPTEISDREVESFYNNYSKQEKLVEKALDNREDYKANELNKSAAISSVKAAEASYMPNISASSGWNWSNTTLTEFDDRGDFSIGFSLFVPIFNNFETDEQVQNAELQLKQAEINKNRIEQQVRNDVKMSLIQLETTQKQLEVSKKSKIAAEKNYESAQERFEVGTASITDFQRANTQYITAQINHVNAVYNYLQAKQEILYSTGVEQ